MVLSQSLELRDQAQLWDVVVAPTLVAHGPEADLQRLPVVPRGSRLRNVSRCS